MQLRRCFARRSKIPRDRQAGQPANQNAGLAEVEKNGTAPKRHLLGPLSTKIQVHA
jgi:hypothetical protein